MTETEIRTIATQNGYDGCRYADEWNGYAVYEPYVDVDGELDYACIGLPMVILVSGDSARVSTPEEALDFLDYEYPDE